MKTNEIITILDEIFEDQKKVLDFYDILELFKEKIGRKTFLLNSLIHDILNILTKDSRYIFVGEKKWVHEKYFNFKNLDKIRKKTYFTYNAQFDKKTKDTK